MVSHLDNAFNHIKVGFFLVCLFVWGLFFFVLLPCGFTGSGWVKVGKTESIHPFVGPDRDAKSRGVMGITPASSHLHHPPCHKNDNGEKDQCEIEIDLNENMSPDQCRPLPLQQRNPPPPPPTYTHRHTHYCVWISGGKLI